MLSLIYRIVCLNDKPQNPYRAVAIGYWQTLTEFIRSFGLPNWLKTNARKVQFSRNGDKASGLKWNTKFFNQTLRFDKEITLETLASLSF